MSADLQPTDVAGMTAFFAAHHPTLLRFVFRRVGDQHLAEEIAVDCLVLAWQHGAPDAIGRPWLFRVAEHRIGDALRRRKRDSRLLDQLRDQQRLSSGTADGAVSEALPHLSSSDQDILRYVYWDELTAEEIAEILGISVTAVWKRSSRAQTRLRRVLEQAGTETGGVGVIRYALD